MQSPSQKVAANGPVFSRIIFGVMKWGIWGYNYNPSEMLQLIDRSLELGVTTFDHADIYGHYTTEETFGHAIKNSPSLRQRIQLISKCGIKMVSPNRPSHKIKSYDTSAAHIIASAERSLRNLRTDYLDMLLIHRPSPLMHPDEIVTAFQQLKESGKVLHFGVSNFTPAQFDLIHSRFPIITNQVQASVIYLYPFLDGTLDQQIELGIKPMAWSPLSGGRVFKDLDDSQVQRVRMVANALGKKYGDYSIDQVLLAWLMKHPAAIFPILGTGKLERLESAVAATQIELTREDWFKIWEASIGQEVP